MNRVIFLIDGFNIYHSVLDIKRHTGYSTKWLDLTSLCNSYIHLFGKDAKVEAIYYFSAIPYYLTAQNPGKIQRHKNYIVCLESTGIQAILIYLQLSENARLYFQARRLNLLSLMLERIKNWLL